MWVSPQALTLARPPLQVNTVQLLPLDAFPSTVAGTLGDPAGVPLPAVEALTGAVVAVAMPEAARVARTAQGGAGRPHPVIMAAAVAAAVAQPVARALVGAAL